MLKTESSKGVEPNSSDEIHVNDPGYVQFFMPSMHVIAYITKLNPRMSRNNLPAV